MKILKQLQQHPFFIKLFHWEYWPFHLVYGPIYFYWIWLCIKSRSIFFFNTSNPSIKNGGFLMESKKEIYDLIPEQFYPVTLFFPVGTSFKIIRRKIAVAGLKFPVIGKPDIGMRGLGVQKLESLRDVEAYTKSSKVDFLLQEFVHFENEVGIFYYRFPGNLHGQISGIVSKEFLSVTGDGFSSVKVLLKRDKRFILQIPALEKVYGDELNEVLPNNKKRLLVPYGNHSRGARFIDISYLIDEQLTRTFDRVCRQVKGFYFGRLDVRYNTWEELKEGVFSIIELNGAGSEPTHIYDHSLLFAWKEIIRHWRILYKISRQNHLLKNIPYMKLKNGFNMISESNEYIKKIA